MLSKIVMSVSISGNSLLWKERDEINLPFICSNMPVPRTYISLFNGYSRVSYLDFLVGYWLWCFTPFSTIFELYRARGSQLYGGKPEYPKKTTDLSLHITYHPQYDQTLELATLVLIGTNNLCNQCLSVVCSIQHYVIKFVSDLRQVGGFLRVQSALLSQYYCKNEHK
jgi:hypothetical protein